MRSVLVPPAEHHKVLFEPIDIGPKTLRNRLYNVPHGTAYGTLRPATWASYRAARAEGGWAVVSTEFSSVDPSSDEWPLHSSDIWDEEDACRHKLMVDSVHDHGALASIELHHGGVHALRRLSREPALSASGMSSDLPPPACPPGTPKIMSRNDIERVQQSFVNAAVRARDVGYDIVDVLAGYGYLCAQFLSPFHNHRTDGYGGSLGNRARFWLETLSQVRDAVGGDCAIATRLAVETQGPWGQSIDDTVALVRMADPLVDLWDLNVGSLDWGSDISPSRVIPEGRNLELFGRVRRAAQKPVVGVSRLTSPDLMAQAVRSGLIDIVGSARQSIADPFFPQKVLEGRTEDIRECMGINHCISSLDRGNLTCAQNATSGEEFRRGWHPERFDVLARPEVSVLVVGAGPAGMEAAIGLAKRGADMVHLVDAAEHLGGHLRPVGRLSGLQEWTRFIDHRMIQIGKLPNLQFIPSTRLDADDIRDYGASHVVVATGAQWSGTGLTPGTHAPLEGVVEGADWVFTPEQLLIEGRRPVEGSQVTVYDAEGYYMGAGVAQLLADEGYKVDLVTPHAQVAAEADMTLEGSAIRDSLHGSGVAMHREVLLSAAQFGRIYGVGQFEEPFTLETDALVLVTVRVPVDGLYQELVRDHEALEEAGIEAVHCIGDALSPRPLADVTFEGHRLAREFESPNPAIALPYKREPLRLVRRGAFSDPLD
ncbi:NAD(P)-binding protein [Nocardioides sp. YIM B13467]|uniref:oxidoreductase n=1 Tax=Nocardioides sp. YIM B13467 TaxID=3366294 RepID=UPI00366F0CB6